jgi:hypothetical protein
MAKRTISGGFETYQRASDGQWSHGMFGEEVDVHKDDVERFDRLHPSVPEVEQIVVVEEIEVFEIPDGDPSAEWSTKQLDAYAEAKDVDVKSAKNKPEKVALLLAAAASA